MSNIERPSLQLVYEGTQIRNNGDLLNLTDMWRAAGADSSKRPAEWLRSDAAVGFVEFVAENFDVGRAHIVKSEKGGGFGGGSTWAHWQIGLAYAKYLDHGFHAYCNGIVRAHVEGRSVVARGSAALADAEKILLDVAKTLRDLTERSSHLATRAEVYDLVEPLATKADLAATAEAIARDVDDRIARRRAPTMRTKRLQLRVVVERFACMCPRCDRTRIVDERGNPIPDVCVWDHWNRRNQNGMTQVWPVCAACNQDLERADNRHKSRGKFDAFLDMQERVLNREPQQIAIVGVR